MTREYIENVIIKCVQCSNDFIWYWREQLDMRYREERMRVSDPTVTLSPPKRCFVCRMRRFKENKGKDRFLEVKKHDDERKRQELSRHNINRKSVVQHQALLFGREEVAAQDYAQAEVVNG